LEYLKYADPLFEIIFVGGLLQPGGSFIDGAPISPFTIANAKQPVDVGDIKNYVEVVNKLIRRSAIYLILLFVSPDHPFYSVTSIFNVLLRTLLCPLCFNMSIAGQRLKLTSLPLLLAFCWFRDLPMLPAFKV
jgi:hypothetical protein